MVDAREGMNSLDEAIAESLRKLDKPVVLVANKIDGLNAAVATVDFYSLALGEPVQIAATHGRGVKELLAQIDTLIPPTEEEIAEEEKGISIAVVGRPNVGKSTLVNRLLGEERVVVFDEAGTTRDSIYIPFERNNQKFTLIDTAGMRRRAKVSLVVEKFSIIKALQAVEKSYVVIYLVDASEGITDQDAHLLGMILEAGRALIIGLNKWDGISVDQKQLIKRQLDVKLPFLDFAEKHPISALHGSGVGKLFDVVHDLYEAAMVDMSTPVLTRILKEAIATHQPPLVRGRRIKLKYAHQGGRNPPTVVIHGVQTDSLPGAYKSFLMNYFRKQLELQGTPVRLVLKSSQNPFKGQKNKLTERQLKKRQRLVKHHKKK
jgi:GTP-binding protein